MKGCKGRTKSKAGVAERSRNARVQSRECTQKAQAKGTARACVSVRCMLAGMEVECRHMVGAFALAAHCKRRSPREV